jgi:ribosome-binding protein aMBF1 (putative translation factor)
MIKNERQYRITKAQAAKFKAALDALRAESAKTHPRLLKAQEDSLRSQLESLERELREYDELRTGVVPPPNIDYLDGIPSDLIKARIAAGLSQKDLADLLGMPEQQVQRYEATDYESASYARLREVAEVLAKVAQHRLHPAGSG